MAPDVIPRIAEQDLVIGEVARAGERRFAYWYDFGDDWWHTIEIEAVGPAQRGVVYQRCTDGAGACPPENCGGPPGFEHFKRALADPDDPDHADPREWYGDDFEPDASSVEKTSALLRQMATGEAPEGWKTW